MPYNSINDLPEQVKKLPLSAKKVFIKAFNVSYSKYGEEASLKIAWSAVKRMFTKKNDTWVRKSAVSVKSVVARTGIFGTKYYFDAIIASNEMAEDGYVATDSLFQKITKSNKIDTFGDIDHYKLFGDNRLNKLFCLTKYSYDNGKLYGKFFVDKTHPKYRWFVDKYKNKEILLSAEFYNPKFEDNKIVDCEKLGWSIALDDLPADKNSIAI